MRYPLGLRAIPLPPGHQAFRNTQAPNTEDGEALFFITSDEELDYLWRKNSCLEKQCEIELLCARVLGKKAHQRGELLDILTEPPALKQPTPIEMPMKRSTNLPLNNGGHKQKDIAVFICRVENVLEFDAAVCLMERDKMMFVKQYLVGNVTAAWDQCCAQHPESNHTRAAIKALLYSQVAMTKHRTNAAFQKLHLVKQGLNQTIMLFGAYIVSTCQGTVITNYNKCMFFWTRMCQEARAAVHKGTTYLTFDACLKAVVEVDTALALMRNTTRLSSPRLKDRWQRRPDMIRARVTHITTLS
jgi:hypothetical protein